MIARLSCHFRLRRTIASPAPTTCSDDSSDGDYDPTRECFIVELEEHDDDAPNNAGNPPAAPPVVPAAPRLATSTNSGMRQAQLEQLRELEAKLQEERKQR
jgi:hypothetical protein